MRAQFRQLATAAILAVSITAILIPATTAAAAPARLTFGLEYSGLALGGNCISGLAADNSTVHVTWKSAGGLVKASVDAQAGPTGAWSYCSETKTLAVGDVLKANDGLGSRSITTPKVTLVADRVHDEFRGKAPANATGTIMYHAGLFADYWDGDDVTADGNGSWSLTPDPSYDLIGGIAAEVNWTNSKGDRFFASAMAPFVEITVDRSAFSVVANPNQQFKATLKDGSTSAILARATVVLDQYGFNGEFTDTQGHPVDVAVGDRFVSNFASDANWIVPDVTASADVATDFVDGQCNTVGVGEGEFASVMVTILRPGGFRGRAIWGVDAAGAFQIDFSQPDSFFFDHANIKHGDRIVVECYQVTGDIVRAIIPVP